MSFTRKETPGKLSSANLEQRRVWMLKRLTLKMKLSAFSQNSRKNDSSASGQTTRSHHSFTKVKDFTLKRGHSDGETREMIPQDLVYHLQSSRQSEVSVA